MPKLVGIKYIAPCLDNSGYAKAARGYIKALHKAGVPITVTPVSFEEVKPSLGEDEELFKELLYKSIEYNVVIVHTTPEFWSKYMEEDKINVGYTIWETTLLPKEWPDLINNSLASLVMVATDWNVDVFIKSGVTKQLCTVPHVSTIVTKKDNSYQVKGLNKDTFVFGFISQFVERKDPLALIKAYWRAFQNEEDVALILKTYRSDYSLEEQEAVRSTIQRLKAVFPLPKYPTIHFISNMLHEGEMDSLFNRIDCYVSLDRGEGWGLSPFQCGALGKPVIVTRFGGVTSYLKPDNSYLVDYKLTPVFGMPYNRWMTSDQDWASADILDGISKMREVFYNKEEAIKKGARLKSFIEEEFNMTRVSEIIINNIKGLI